MIRWYKNLYVGDNAKKDERKIKRKVESGRVVPGIYLITYASNPKNQLDIFPASLLKQKAFYCMCPEVIGIAKGYEEAVELIQMLAEKAYVQTQCKNIREYLEQQEE